MGDRRATACSSIRASAAAPTCSPRPRGGGNDALRELVAATTGEATRVLELYAGSGNFTRDLRGKVTAVEEHPAAVQLGRVNAPGATHVVARVKDYLIKADDPPDLVLLDPPRSGTGPEVTALLNELGARRIVYVSCDPATFARDAARLTSYQLERLVPPRPGVPDLSRRGRRPVRSKTRTMNQRMAAAAWVTSFCDDGTSHRPLDHRLR